MLSWMPGEPQRQTLRQGFLGESFIKEVLQKEIKAIGKAGQVRGRSQAKKRLQAIPERVA